MGLVPARIGIGVIDQLFRSPTKGGRPRENSQSYPTRPLLVHPLRPILEPVPAGVVGRKILGTDG